MEEREKSGGQRRRQRQIIARLIKKNGRDQHNSVYQQIDMARLLRCRSRLLRVLKVSPDDLATNLLAKGIQIALGSANGYHLHVQRKWMRRGAIIVRN